MKFLLPLCCLLLSISASAQSLNPKKIAMDVDLGFGVYYQFSSFGNTQSNRARIPDLLPRRINDPQVRNNWGLDDDLVTDNPFFHGSYFFRLGGQFSYDSTLFVTVAANMEQRGFSDGQFSTNTINIFPYFNARYAKQYGKFSYLLQVGDFWDMELYEGLTFYNLQTQSWVFKFKYGPFYLKHLGIGDLFRGIGLRIDDLYDYSFGVEQLRLGDDNLKLDIRTGYSNNRGSTGGGFWNLSTRLAIKEFLEVYSQYSTADGGGGFLLGADLMEQTVGGVTYKVSASYRSYAAGFNDGYTNTVYYRDPEGSGSFTNSTADVFFPLEVYERPFGQWAVFTEYQGLDVQGFNLKGTLNCKLFWKTFFRTKLDLNWINTEEEYFLYPFFTVGLGYQSEEDVDIMLEWTNRVLNLDKNYPTLYASQESYFMIRAYKPLSYLKDNDRYHRE